MKYHFKKYLKLDTTCILNFDKDSGAYVFMTTIGDLYSLSFTNQRAYYYREGDLSYEDKTSIFSVEGVNKVFGFIPGYGYQRRTNDARLKAIANYLITKGDKIEYYLSKSEDEIKEYIENLGGRAFFPNNIIVSMNNEKYHNFDLHRLFLDEEKTENKEDFINFRNYIEHVTEGFIFLNDGKEIDLSNKEIELCRVENNILYIPLFELSEDTSNEDLQNFLSQSLVYDGGFREKLDEVRKLERYYKIAWIIDGQHRTMSLKFLDEEIEKLKNEIKKKLKETDYQIDIDAIFQSEKIKNKVLNTHISVTTYMSSSIEEQANIFIDINNNAKPVDKSLTYDLLPLTETSQSVELAAKKLFDDFNKDKNSPFYKFLYNIRSQDKKEKDGENIQKILSQANFINEIKNYFKVSRGQEKIFYPYFKNKDLTPVYWLIYSFFTKINQKYIDEIYDDKKSALYRTTGFGALLQFLVFLIEQVKKKQGDGIIKKYDKSQFENTENEINKLFQTSIDIIAPKIGFTRSELSSFRGKAGQTELADIMKIISGLQRIEDINDESKREKIETQMKIFES